MWPAAVALAGFVAYVLHALLLDVRYSEVIDFANGTSPGAIAFSMLATLVCHGVLVGHDSLAVRHLGATVKRSTLVLTSFAATAVGHAVGIGEFSARRMRQRLYLAAGLEPAQIERAIDFDSVASGLGWAAFGAFGLIAGARQIDAISPIPAWASMSVGIAIAALILAFIGLCARERAVMVTLVWRFRLPLPPVKLVLVQFGMSVLDLSAAAVALWVLLPHGAIDPYAFMAVYALGAALSVASRVPGGLGVFDAVILLACVGAPAPAVLGALLVYRGIFVVLPLVAATGAMALHEVEAVTDPVGRIAVSLSPKLMAGMALVAGLWLLVSGVTPGSEHAQELLEMNVPLPLVEASHFLGSVAGLGLLLVARGLLHQLDAAWWMALILSIVAAALALPKGLAVHEVLLLTSLAILLIISRHQFDRKSSLFAQRLERGWLIAMAGVIAACVWVLFFAYQEVDYSNRLWWEFTFDGGAPRSLRAITAIAVLGLGFCLWQLLRPPTGELTELSAADLERAAAIVRTSPSSDACFVLTADKQLLFSPSGKSFLMYDKRGRSWVSLFGPIGDEREWPDLIWSFVELAGAHGGRPAFYRVEPDTLPIYLDCGLHAFKLGEQAWVPLRDFNLKGAKRANLRSGVNRAEREGLTFQVVSPDEVAALLPQLREVSDAWLSEQKAREKGFSVGAFDDDYLQRLPVAVAWRGEEILAFANLLSTDAKVEASIDLMRHRPGSPPGTMDFLFAKIMLHLQAQGFDRFGLGMSPMSGMAERRKAPRWQRFGRLLFEHGERFYNFRGLHNFKDKFEPTWEARYLCAPGGAAPVLALIDIAALIGGGVKGAMGK
jgi:phosphatidylglycerol lysyltransferase